MSSVSDALGVCIGSVALAFFIMVFAANVARLLSAGLEEEDRE